MKRAEVLNRLKLHEAELRSAGIASLYLFGSTARGEAATDSDVDLAYEIDETKKVGLIELSGIQLDLEALLSADVDFVDRNYLRPGVKERVAAEMVRVF